MLLAFLLPNLNKQIVLPVHTQERHLQGSTVQCPSGSDIFTWVAADAARSTGVAGTDW